MSVTPPGRILVVGDLHANTGAGFSVIDHAAALAADLILQVGDFGFWFDPQGSKYLRKMEGRLAARDLRLWWVDGNHEQFDRLNAIPVGDDGRRQISEHIWHLPRGFRWQWDNTAWVAAGGAVSVDQNYRTEGKTWFPAEELTDQQVAQIIADGSADIVVAHDAPLGIPFLRIRLGQDKPAWRRESQWPTGLIVRSDEHQRRVRRARHGPRPSQPALPTGRRRRLDHPRSRLITQLAQRTTQTTNAKCVVSATCLSRRANFGVKKPTTVSLDNPEPPSGIEPETYALRERRSTD